MEMPRSRGVKWILILGILLGADFFIPDPSPAGNIGDPGATLNQGKFSAGPEFSGVSREIRDGNGIRYDTESWRLLLKGSYGITDWMEGFGRLGGATFQIRGTPYDSNPGIAGGAGLKATFLDPSGHPLRYSLGGQLLL